MTITSRLDPEEFRWHGGDLEALAGIFGVSLSDVEVVDGSTVRIVEPTANWSLIPDRRRTTNES